MPEEVQWRTWHLPYPRDNGVNLWGDYTHLCYSAWKTPDKDGRTGELVLINANKKLRKEVTLEEAMEILKNIIIFNGEPCSLSL